MPPTAHGTANIRTVEGLMLPYAFQTGDGWEGAPMVDALVQTKLVLPRVRPELVDRSRLTDPLARARDVALVLVSAPAGFGKTTLLASILGDGTPVA